MVVVGAKGYGWPNVCVGIQTPFLNNRLSAAQVKHDFRFHWGKNA